MTAKNIRRWKFLRDGLKSNYDGHQWTIGKWQKTECLELCHGFNCSRRVIDAMAYVQGEILAEVEVQGQHFDGNDKSTHEDMRIIRAWKWTKNDSVALSIFAAEMVLENFEKVYPDDDRPRKAIEAAKNYLDSPTEKNRSAAESAESAAWTAAQSAAESAMSAAWTAAESAAMSAAWTAAESAAWSAAESAAWSAARTAAMSAAWTAAESAAMSAARTAAESAAWTAESAARTAAWSAARTAAMSAALDQIETWLLNHIEQMEEWK